MIIEEYPFTGIIKRTVTVEDPDTKDTSEEVFTVYSGEMDCSMNTAEVGKIAQTSDYVVSMPLVKDSDGKYILPKKNDEIEVSTYDDIFLLTVNNYMPSQLGGITIYASRGDW